MCNRPLGIMEPPSNPFTDDDEDSEVVLPKHLSADDGHKPRFLPPKDPLITSDEDTQSDSDGGGGGKGKPEEVLQKVPDLVFDYAKSGSVRNLLSGNPVKSQRESMLIGRLIGYADRQSHYPPPSPSTRTH